MFINYKCAYILLYVRNCVFKFAVKHFDGFKVGGDLQPTNLMWTELIST
jgi:hypothetical protein